jgi:hypothetical protein
VPDNDMVARVDDTTLDRHTFAKLVEERESTLPNEADDPDRVGGETARAIVSQFITIELVRRDLERLGVEIPPVDSSLTGVAKLDAEFQAAGQAFVAQGKAGLGDEQLHEWYDQGPIATGVVCVQHILVASKSDADAVLERVNAGEVFGDIATDTSLDTQTAAQGGAVGCQALSAFDDIFDEALHGEIGEASQPVESQLGHHILRIMPFDELSDNDMVVARLIALGQWHDVETDPEIGTWQWVRVVQLG